MVQAQQKHTYGKACATTIWYKRKLNWTIYVELFIECNEYSDALFILNHSCFIDYYHVNIL